MPALAAGRHGAVQVQCGSGIGQGDIAAGRIGGGECADPIGAVERDAVCRIRIQLGGDDAAARSSRLRDRAMRRIQRYTKAARSYLRMTARLPLLKVNATLFWVVMPGPAAVKLAVVAIACVTAPGRQRRFCRRPWPMNSD
jgi:hypothetical protein